MKLPVAFEKKMKEFLKDEYNAYLKSYELPKYQGFRVNTLKTTMDEWEEINPFQNIKSVPWCKQGFYYVEERPAKHPYYYAGLYYMQEPSAMAPGSYIPIEPGDKVLDLCAAPGGKSTQVAAKLGHTGLLVANDISASRAKALLKNIENFGVRSFVVTSETPEKLASQCSGYFDKILIDAPCSGEGMFRKDEGAIKSWETHGIEYCCNLQREILDYAAQMLKVGGMILYSTCTFSPEENEGMIQEFLNKHKAFQVLSLEPIGGITKGRPEWIGADESLTGALRLWPHHLEGEGHFVCLLQKVQGEEEKCERLAPKKMIKDYEALKLFIEEYTHLPLDLPVIEHSGKIYLVHPDAPALKGIRIVRSGLLLGELKNKRFEPSYALPLAYPKEMFKNTISFERTDTNVIKYLKGETLIYEAPKGYHVICVEDYPLGWVKAQNNTLKNQYPPTWRMMG
ncbi:MAG: RsmF rRNA methyltransferase first C-terminal domain-containing protein [Cellulosilyticaceae bacterium]